VGSVATPQCQGVDGPGCTFVIHDVECQRRLGERLPEMRCRVKKDRHKRAVRAKEILDILRIGEDEELLQGFERCSKITIVSCHLLFPVVDYEQLDLRV